jgi:hypothetical protein
LKRKAKRETNPHENGPVVSGIGSKTMPRFAKSAGAFYLKRLFKRNSPSI